MAEDDPLVTRRAAFAREFEEPAMPLSEVARLLAIGKSTAHRLVVGGELRGIRIGNTWRVLRRDFDAYVEQRRAEAEHWYQELRRGTGPPV